jgi:hypothetical protein
MTATPPCLWFGGQGLHLDALAKCLSLVALAQSLIAFPKTTVYGWFCPVPRVGVRMSVWYQENWMKCTDIHFHASESSIWVIIWVILSCTEGWGKHVCLVPDELNEMHRYSLSCIWVQLVKWNLQEGVPANIQLVQLIKWCFSRTSIIIWVIIWVILSCTKGWGKDVCLVPGELNEMHRYSLSRIWVQYMGDSVLYRGLG